MSKFEAPSCNIFWDIKLSISKHSKGNKYFLKKKLLGNLLIIVYQLTKFEATSCYTFWDILITKFHYNPLKGA